MRGLKYMAKRIIYGCVSVALVLCLGCQAKDYNERIGPYDVNFTLDDKIASMAEMIQNITSIETPEGIPYTKYLLISQIKGTNFMGWGGFWIEHYGAPLKMNLEALAKDKPASGIRADTVCNSSNQTIDGHEGIVVDCCCIGKVKTHRYRFAYQLDNQTSVSGFYGTGDFLKSLHVSVT